jgi:hypothetical protein
MDNAQTHALIGMVSEGKQWFDGPGILARAERPPSLGNDSRIVIIKQLEQQAHTLRVVPTAAAGEDAQQIN